MTHSAAGHAHGHSHQHPHHHQHSGHEAEQMARVLELDAVVTGHYVDEVAERIADLIPQPRTIVDLGSGTGFATVALARRFPTAQVIAIDNSTEMLATTRAAAETAGVADRVRLLDADLASALPAELSDVDVVWASSTLHHFADATALLSSAHAALRPGGVLVAVEIADLPTFLPASAPDADAERRIRDALTQLGWNAHPDWAPAITEAGFHLVGTAVLPAGATPATQAPVAESTVAEYAIEWLTRVRSGLEAELSAGDREVLDRLLSDDASSLANRGDLAVSGSRTLWLGQRSAAEDNAVSVDGHSVDGPTVDGHSVDVVVIGGGAAGLSGATALGRSLRSVLVVDAGEPRNAPADGAHNLLGHEGIAPLELLAKGRAEARGYGVEVTRDTVVGASRTRDDLFELSLASGASVRARRLLLASGLVDELPDIPGVADLWGTDVLHCPYCHGYEVRGKRVVIIGTNPMAMHQALLFSQLTDTLTVIDHSIGELPEPELAQMRALGVEIVPGPIDHLVVEQSGSRPHLGGIVLADGTGIEADAAVVAPRFRARGEVFAQLGGALTEHPFGEFIETDPMGATSVPGVWAAGNASNLSAMVAVSMGAGVMAGAAINADLAAADARAAVARVPAS